MTPSIPRLSLPRGLSAAKGERVTISDWQPSGEHDHGARLATFTVTTAVGISIYGCMLIAGSGGRLVFKFPHRRIPGGYVACVSIEDPRAAVRFEDAVFAALKAMGLIA